MCSNADQSGLAIAVHNISKRYEIYTKPIDRLKQILWPGQRNFYQEFWALRDISFEVPRGESLGIIGRNGAGKSTLLQIIAGTLQPSTGSVRIQGRVTALLELGSGFNPEFTGRENVYLNGTILGLSREEIDARFDEIASFADIGSFLEQPIKTYSTGMVVRLAFAVQVLVDPDILIVDEALAVGDAAFQAKCMSRMRRLVDNGVVVILVTHDVNAVRMLCSRALWLHDGRIHDEGNPMDVTSRYVRFLFEEESGKTEQPTPAEVGPPDPADDEPVASAEEDPPVTEDEDAAESAADMDELEQQEPLTAERQSCKGWDWSVMTNVPPERRPRDMIKEWQQVHFPHPDPIHDEAIALVQELDVEPGRNYLYTLELLDCFQNTRYAGRIDKRIFVNDRLVWQQDISHGTACGWQLLQFRYRPQDRRLKIQLELRAIGYPDAGWRWGDAATLGVRNWVNDPIEIGNGESMPVGKVQFIGAEQQPEGRRLLNHLNRRTDLIRWGNGSLVLEGYALDNGVPGHEALLEHGGRLHLDLEFKAVRDINSESIGFGFAFRNMTGLDIITVTTWEAGLRFPPLVRGQRVRLSFELQNILAPTHYALVVNAEEVRAPLERHYYDFVENVMVVKVIAKHVCFSAVLPQVEASYELLGESDQAAEDRPELLTVSGQA